MNPILRARYHKSVKNWNFAVKLSDNFLLLYITNQRAENYLLISEQNLEFQKACNIVLLRLGLIFERRITIICYFLTF